MLAAALRSEADGYVERYEGVRDERGHALVVRNGHGQARQVTMGSGTVTIAAPRVNDRQVDAAGEHQRFTSQILPPYLRRSPKVGEVLPILYLRGLSTGDFRDALPVLFGAGTPGLSPANIARLTTCWEAEYRGFAERSLAESDYVYVWADGIYLDIRLEDDRLCLLVMIGVRADGTKELIALEDGYRESTESWLSVLRGLKARGMKPPTVAVGDGALGFWAAVHQVWPETRQQRCWVHRLRVVLDKLPKRLQPKAKEALRDILKAATRAHAEKGIADFVDEYGAKYPKAAESLTRDQDELLTYFDFPAEHWKSLRTTNVVESPFATVRLRQRVTKGNGSRIKALTMAFKLLEMAERRWRKLDGPKLLPLVRAGARFKDGVLIETQHREGERAA